MESSLLTLVWVPRDENGAIDYINCDPANSALGLSYPPVVLEGCTDVTALNYDATADSCDGIIGGTDTSCCTYPPANDDCSGAIAVACGDVVSGSNVNSTIGNEVLALECGTEIEGPGVWYSFSSAGSEEVTFSTCGLL